MKRKCRVCGNEYEIVLENHYISKDIGVTGLATIAKKEEEKLYDTFDCPHCGCQDVIQERKRLYEPTVDDPEDTDNDDNEEEIDYDREEDCFGDYDTFSMCRNCERKDGCKKASKTYEVELND